jgi:hypothetical protein
MNSWDCFDTLIARRFYHPHSIFDIVAEKLQIPNFKQMRISAEINSNQTYDGIYKNLPQINSQIEIETELEHCFPIIENINKVEDGDLIISDMYHSATFIESLLRKCGLNKDVKFLVHPNHKSSGEIWKLIKGINIHTGDNLHSDIAMAKKYNIKTSYYTECHFTDVEKRVFCVDKFLAYWMRYIRLSFPYLTEKEKKLWVDQSQSNLPALALGSLELPTDKNMVFNYRDCIYWRPMYEKITKRTSKEFHSSRAYYIRSSIEYREYAYSRIKDSVLVDLQGSGNSVDSFFGKDIEYLYLAGPSKKSITKVPSDAIEKHNCADIGTLIGWDKNGPIRDKCEHDKTTTSVQKTASSFAINSINLFGNFHKNSTLLKLLVEIMSNNYTNYSVNHRQYH